LAAALYLEDATGVVLSDSQIARALSDPGAIDWVMPQGEPGS
jgi:hypothetical protein